MSSGRLDSSRKTVTRKRCQLAAGLLAIALVWGVLLPRAAQIPAIRQHIDRLDAANINTGAMFYTELEPIP